jgi:hypothetical protein
MNALAGFGAAEGIGSGRVYPVNSERAEHFQ